MKINELQKIQSDLYDMQDDKIKKGDYEKSREMGRARRAIRDIIIKEFKITS